MSKKSGKDIFLLSAQDFAALIPADNYDRRGRSSNKRLINIIRNEGQRLVGEILLDGQEGFKALPGCGKMTLNNFLSTLKEHGLTFKNYGSLSELQLLEDKSPNQKRELLAKILDAHTDLFTTDGYIPSLNNTNQSGAIVVSIDIQDEFQRQVFVENFDKGRELNDGCVINGSFNQIAFNALGMMVYNPDMLSNAHAKSSIVRIRKTDTGVQIILEPKPS